jgi:hypothetical protein
MGELEIGARAGRAGNAVATFFSRIGQHPPLPEYALHYYDSLKAKFETLPEPPASDGAARNAYFDAKAVAERARESLRWSDLMLLDLSIVRSLGFDALRLKIADLRAKLDGAAPPLPDGLVPKLDAATPARHTEALRAEAELLVTRVWHLRMARNARDRYVGELRSTIFNTLLAIVLLVFPAIFLLFKVPPLYLVIIAAGMLGALASFLRRLQAVATSAPNPDQSSDLSALAYEKRAALMSLAVGGVFAIVLYMMFAAGLGNVMGDMGPKFIALEELLLGGATFATFTDMGPATGGDYAKVLVWAFIAGFFEQLVPDVLDRVAHKKQ